VHRIRVQIVENNSNYVFYTLVEGTTLVQCVVVDHTHVRVDTIEPTRRHKMRWILECLVDDYYPDVRLSRWLGLYILIWLVLSGIYLGGL